MKHQNQMTNHFVNVLGQRAALLERQDAERNAADHNFWHDTGVMYNIPRFIYNMKHREYFGGLEQRHKEELATFDKMNLERLPDGGVYTESPSENIACNEDVRKQYRQMKIKHAAQKTRALNDFFDGVPEKLRETIKGLYKMKVIGLEEAQEEEIKESFDKLTMTKEDDEDDVEHEANQDVPLHGMNPLKLNLQGLNDAEVRYANQLFEEFAKCNRSVPKV